MRVFGYDAAACKRAVLDGYRPASYLGFAVGAVYQHAMLRIMVEVVFAGVEGVPEYEFFGERGPFRKLTEATTLYFPTKTANPWPTH